MLSRVMMSVLRPRILVAASFTSINSKRPKLAFFIVEEEIDVRSIARLVASRRAEEVEMLHTEAPELRFMLSQTRYGFGALHVTILTQESLSS